MKLLNLYLRNERKIKFHKFNMLRINSQKICNYLHNTEKTQ